MDTKNTKIADGCKISNLIKKKLYNKITKERKQ